MEETEVVNFILLNETGPNDILLFGCKGEKCSQKKITSHQLESHMRDIHEAYKFTVALNWPMVSEQTDEKQQTSRKREDKRDGYRQYRGSQAPSVSSGPA
jgi:hypothetical protein